MHKFFLDVLYFLDEIDIIFVQFRLRVDNRDDAGGLGIKDEGFHFGNLTKNGVEVVLGYRQKIEILFLFVHSYFFFELSGLIIK